jgi:hypothetical protein
MSSGASPGPVDARPTSGKGGNLRATKCPRPGRTGRAARQLCAKVGNSPLKRHFLKADTPSTRVKVLAGDNAAVADCVPERQLCRHYSGEKRAFSEKTDLWRISSAQFRYNNVNSFTKAFPRFHMRCLEALLHLAFICYEFLQQIYNSG